MNHLVQSLKEKITDQISLVRQAPNDDEEFYQVHLDIFYKPTSEMQSLENLYGTKILMRTSLTIFETRRFCLCQDKEYLKVKIYLDET